MVLRDRDIDNGERLGWRTLFLRERERERERDEVEFFLGGVLIFRGKILRYHNPLLKNHHHSTMSVVTNNLSVVPQLLFISR